MNFIQNEIAFSQCLHASENSKKKKKERTGKRKIYKRFVELLCEQNVNSGGEMRKKKNQ